MGKRGSSMSQGLKDGLWLLCCAVCQALGLPPLIQSLTGSESLFPAGRDAGFAVAWGIIAVTAPSL